MFYFIFSLLALCLPVTLVECLDSYENYREGSCSSIRWPSGAGAWNASFYDWANNLSYLPAGNKYHFYRIASIHSLYHEIGSTDFEKEFCFSRDAFVFDGKGRSTAYGLDRGLADFDIDTRLRNERGGLTRYWDYTPKSPLPRSDVLQQVITLSDGRSFVFVTGCWKESNQKTWVVISVVPRLTYYVRRQIMDHAIELGFRRDNFVFLDYEKCWTNNPFLSLRFGTGSAGRDVAGIKSLKEQADLEEKIRDRNRGIGSLIWPTFPQTEFPEIISRVALASSRPRAVRRDEFQL